MARWFLTMKKADFQKNADKFHISPIIARLIRNRDVVEEGEIEQYLNGTIADLSDGILMKDADKAIAILTEKIQENKRIRVIGDYDIDGVNATYILQEALAGLGAIVDTDIPDRMKDGYGLNQNLIDRAVEDGIDTVVTCDNGIAAGEEIAYGKEKGLTIIVTDHHEIPYEEIDGEKHYILPPADAVVDPKQKDCTYPFKELCGAAVAYKLMEAFYEALGKEEEDLDYLMEHVAIATIGDVMDLIGENRILVKQGLEMMRRTSSLGLKALMECNGINPDQLSAYHIGFVLGPCMNASGRLDTAKRTLELFRASSEKEAAMLAGDLKALNDSRKDMTLRSVETAVHMVETTELKQDKVLVVYLPECHESIAGIVAGRLRERFYKPTFVLTKAEDGVKGSGRSIEAYHMYEELNRCSVYLTKFGGHKLAAGLSMQEANIDAFRSMLNAKTTLTNEDLEEKISIDMQLPLEYVTESLIGELDLLAPYGKGNRKPLFVEKNLKVLQPKIIGRNSNVLKMTVQNERGMKLDAIYFGEVQECLNYILSKQTMAFTFYPSINEYMGRKSVQITIVNYQ
ncbi:MAG: single-stranded-DNA-specific exonuclease RecJ [Hespellia sp.]|nr:single-stranded-DNA-specific exonuclease RecJ [Hespellia sp.]